MILRVHIIPMLVLIQMAIFTFAMIPFFLNIYSRDGNIALRQNENYKNCIVLLSVLFLVFASYDGDWYHYLDIVNQIYTNPTSFTHLESFQIWTILNVSFGNYYLWRLLIWGGAVFFLYKALDRLKTNNLVTWSVFIAMSLIQISTGRVYLGLSMLFYGYSLIITAKSHIRFILFGILLIISSLFIHKSMFIYICGALISLIKFQKWMIILVLCCLPIFIGLFMEILVLYLFSGDVDNNINSYLSEETAALGWGINIYNYVIRICQIVLFICATIYVIKLKNNNLKITRIWQFSFASIFTYLVVYGALTANQIGSTSISARTLMPLYYTIPILVSDMIKERFKLKINLAFIMMLYIISVYRLLYAYYLQKNSAGV